MARLTPLTPDQLGAEQRALHATIDAERPGARTRGDGSLLGPFDAFLRNPKTGSRMLELGSALRFQNTIPRPAIEVAILCVGRKYEAEFEWWAHARMAESEGVEPRVIHAIFEEKIPAFADETQGAVYRATLELLAGGRLSDGAYETLKDLIGEAGLFDLFALVGFYISISLILNGFEVPLPEGEKPHFG